MSAFNRLLAFRGAQLPKHAALRPQVNIGFIRILTWLNSKSRAENAQYWAALVHAGPGGAASVPSPARPGEGAFLGNAIQVVASLDDKRAIPALLDDIETGEMATRALARFGNLTLPALLQRVRSPTAGTVVCASSEPHACLQDLHAASLRALTEMAAPAIFSALTPANRARIQEVITSAIRSVPLDVRHGGDRVSRQVIGIRGAGLLGNRNLEPLLLRVARGALNPMVRMSGVIALGDLRDPSLRPALAKIAGTDPDGDVRGAARLALKKLSSAP